MKYRNLGKSGLEVSEVGLGCNNFGRRWDYERAKTIIGGALDNGINFLDTADVYSDGESESIIGRALHGIRDQVVIGTKFAGAMGDGAQLQRRIAEVPDRRVGCQPAKTTDRLRRPLPDARSGPVDADTRDPARPRRHGDRRQGALHRLLQLSWLGDRRRRVDLPNRTPRPFR